MYLLTYHCRPNKNYDGKPVGGAFINCYIKTNSLDKAREIAVADIENNNWIVIKETDVDKIDKSFFDSDSPKMEYYQQALIDKEVYVYYTYPERKKKLNKRSH